MMMMIPTMIPMMKLPMMMLTMMMLPMMMIMMIKGEMSIPSKTEMAAEVMMTMMRLLDGRVDAMVRWALKIDWTPPM